MAFRIARLIIFLAGATLAFGDDQSTLPDFTTLTLDQLVNVKVTSFTRKQQKLSQVAGAVYVITQEQIARSGLTSVPELLRLAPGVDVARVNGNQWSISARSTVGIYANKLLVLIDGRSVYSPIFAGVYWELGMPMLDDIDRIEVIRGPGATVWGANAVAGVINIITKRSQDTHGTTVTAGAGSSDRAFGTTRWGGQTGSTNYRAYFGGSDNAPLSQASSGGRANDAWNSVQGGFRLDGAHGKDTWTVEGDLSRAAENETGISPSLLTQSAVTSPVHFDSIAGNITGEWRRHFGESGDLRVQSYYDYADRPEPQNSTVETRTWDGEVQYDFTAKHIHNLSVGAGERVIHAQAGADGTVYFSPAEVTWANVSAFAQDEMHFAHDTLLFTVGAKLEHNHFGGWGPEPSANLMWMPKKHHSIWISSARALRTPSLFEVAVVAPFTVIPASPETGGLPVLNLIDGTPGFKSESVADFEAGYRGQIAKKFSLDIATFYDRYSDVRSFRFGSSGFSPAPVFHVDVTGYTGNDVEATGKGGEASIAWQVLPDWKLEGSYTYNLQENWLSASAAPGSVYAAGKLPSRNKWRLQSYVNLSKSWKLDGFLYWTSQGSPTNTFGPNILVPSYTRLDIRLGYKIGRHWQLSLAGQNLLQTRHLEAISELLTTSSYVNRSVYLKSTWQF